MQVEEFTWKMPFSSLISSSGKISDPRKTYVLNKSLPKSQLRYNLL